MLVKQDIAKKKQALNEEKNLINERLNARKSAIDTEEKYEQLAELRKQLALIEADPTRTKDAKELRKQIRDLEKDMSWEIAEKEAQAAMEMIDDEQKALDQWQQYQENEMNDILKNNNSPLLAEELAEVLGDESSTREERLANYLEWLQANDENYKYGTEEMRLQMQQNSEDAWNKMIGFVETYWDEIASIIDDGADRVANFLTERLAARGISETGITLQALNAQDMYNAYVSAIKDTAEWDHNHEIVDSIDKLKDYTYKVEFIDKDFTIIDAYMSALEYKFLRDKSISDEASGYEVDDLYTGIAKVIEETSNKPTENTAQTGHDQSGGSYIYTQPNDTSWIDAFAKKIVDGVDKIAEALKPSLLLTEPSGGAGGGVGGPGAITRHAKGGLVDYTGLAWVDGTLTEPEAFLSAKDTKAIRSMLDAFNYISVSPGVVPSTDLIGDNSSTIGDINITINQAELKSDADVEELARQVGKAFTKQLSKNGFNTANYSF